MPRLAKGSKDAAERMAHLRSFRKKKGGSIDPPPVPEEKEGEGIQTPWVKHVADLSSTADSSNHSSRPCYSLVSFRTGSAYVSLNALRN